MGSLQSPPAIPSCPPMIDQPRSFLTERNWLSIVTVATRRRYRHNVGGGYANDFYVREIGASSTDAAQSMMLVKEQNPPLAVA